MKEELENVQDRLIDWNQRHAWAVLAGTALSVAFSSAWWLVCVAASSFAALLLACRGRWRRPNRFGPANAVTSLRLVGILALPQIAAHGPLVVAAAALALSALDGVDGWVARRSGLATEFGEYFDKEADALLMLVLCLLLYDSGRLAIWILVPGLLRYGFVVFLMLAQPPARKERRSASGKWICFGATSALIAAFTPFPALYEPYVTLMAALLLYSFAAAVAELYRGGHARRG